jgi:hypothetical protein
VIRALVLALLLALVAAVPAQAGILSADDAADLAQSLADAQEEQDICYGWEVSNNFSDTGDLGSSTGGPERRLLESLETRGCAKGFVELLGDINYSCDSCESEDSAGISISSGGLASPPTVKDLEEMGLKAGDLTGDKDDTTLINMVNALPLLVADRGNAPYVAYEPSTGVPAADHATGSPGSDFIREEWGSVLLFGVLLLGGPGYFLYNRYRPST